MTNSAQNATHGSDSQTATRTLPISRAILSATLVVGVLDATDGVVFLGLYGQNPIQVLQYIASSLLGAQSFSGGLSSAGLGLVLHFAVSLVVVTIYILASRRVAVLRPPLDAHGAAVWCCGVGGHEPTIPAVHCGRVSPDRDCGFGQRPHGSCFVRWRALLVFRQERGDNRTNGLFKA